MNKQRTLTLSILSLLGAALLLPGAASAHERGNGHRTDRCKHQRHVERHQHQRHEQRRDNDWYLRQHRAERTHGYRTIEHTYRVEPVYSERVYRVEQRHEGGHPVELVIDYRITL